MRTYQIRIGIRKALWLVVQGVTDGDTLVIFFFYAGHFSPISLCFPYMVMESLLQ